MRYIKIFCILILAALPATSSGQESVSRSRLTGIELSVNSKKENRTNILNNYLSRMDSFAIRNNFRIDKSASELLYTDADSLFNRLKKTGWNITATSEADFYQIKKGANRYLAYVSYDIALWQFNLAAPVQRKNNLYYAVAGVFLIRQR